MCRSKQGPTRQRPMGLPVVCWYLSYSTTLAEHAVHRLRWCPAFGRAGTCLFLSVQWNMSEWVSANLSGGFACLGCANPLPSSSWQKCLIGGAPRSFQSVHVMCRNCPIWGASSPGYHAVVVIPVEGDNYKWWWQNPNFGDRHGCLVGKYNPFGKKIPS